MIKLIHTLLFTSLILILSPSIQAQGSGDETLPENVPALLVKANSAFAAKDYRTFRKAMERLHAKRPYNSDYMYQLVNAYALLDEKQAAYDLMLRMQKQGLSYDFNQSDNTLNIRNTEVFDYINDLMKIAGEPVGDSEVVLTLPQYVVMPEAIAWDASRQEFLVGTSKQGSLFAVGKDGTVQQLLKADDTNGLWSIFGLLADPSHNRLWISSAVTPAFDNYSVIDRGRSALFEFNLETLELVRRYPVPVDGSSHKLGSMALGPRGDVYIADRVLPIIYTKPVAEHKLKIVLGSREMLSLRGIAIRPGGHLLYVADRELGILVVDVDGRRAGKLVVPENLNIGGIDGMYFWDNRLIIIQNGIKPQRLMRLQLDADGTSVVGVRPLAVAQPEFDFPSFGTLVGKDLFYFGNSQWAASKGALKPVRILRTSVDSSEDLVQPDLQQFLRKQAELQQAKEKSKE